MEIGQIVTKEDTAQQQAKGTGTLELVPRKVEQGQVQAMLDTHSLLDLSLNI